VSPLGEARRATLRGIVERRHIVGTVTNRGRTDSKVVGGAAATMACVEGEQGRDQAHELGEGVNQYDAFGLNLAGLS
jgi:hypothetical protein